MRGSSIFNKAADLYNPSKEKQTSCCENCLNKSLSNNLWGFKRRTVPKCALIVRVVLCYDPALLNDPFRFIRLQLFWNEIKNDDASFNQIKTLLKHLFFSA